MGEDDPVELEHGLGEGSLTNHILAVGYTHPLMQTPTDDPPMDLKDGYSVGTFQKPLGPSGSVPGGTDVTTSVCLLHLTHCPLRSLSGSR